MALVISAEKWYYYFPRKAAQMKKGKRKKESYQDVLSAKFVPTKPMDLSKVKTVGDMVKQMEFTSFGARNVGEAANVLYEMYKDKDCYTVLTISGAMTVAKMGSIACDMIENGMADAVVTTGAVITHGFVEGLEKAHFKVDAGTSDIELYHSGCNRVYDTLELESSLNDMEKIVEKVLDGINREKELCSSFIAHELGKFLSKHSKMKNILRSAYEKNVPVFIPAFTDSELGLDVGLYNRRAAGKGGKRFSFDPFLDLEAFTKQIEKQKTLGIFTIGGGVPRNWAQQVCPYLDIIASRLNEKTPFMRYKYGVRICPEPVHWGGLSGCTYQEGVSWGKFVPVSEGGRWAEVYCDATIAWPLIVKAVLERL